MLESRKNDGPLQGPRTREGDNVTTPLSEVPSPSI